jgi:hypothetical protein
MSGKTPVQVLREARELIAMPERWTQGTWARKANGDGVLATNPEACCFCAGGALLKSSSRGRKENRDLFDAAVRLLIAPLNGETWMDIAQFNDRVAKSHDEVLALFDRAIALAESEATP